VPRIASATKARGFRLSHRGRPGILRDPPWLHRKGGIAGSAEPSRPARRVRCNNVEMSE